MALRDDTFDSNSDVHALIEIVNLPSFMKITEKNIVGGNVRVHNPDNIVKNVETVGAVNTED